jgi:hypothetical protein
MPETLQIKPPLPVRTPFGDCLALFITMGGLGEHNLWHVVTMEGGEFWSLQNPEVRLNTSFTDNIKNLTPFSKEIWDKYDWLKPDPDMIA